MDRSHFSPVVPETSNACQYLSVGHSQPMFSGSLSSASRCWHSPPFCRFIPAVAADALPMFARPLPFQCAPRPDFQGQHLLLVPSASLWLLEPAPQPRCGHAAGLEVGQLRPSFLPATPRQSTMGADVWKHGHLLPQVGYTCAASQNSSMGLHSLAHPGDLLIMTPLLQPALPPLSVFTGMSLDHPHLCANGHLSIYFWGNLKL